MFRAGLLFLMSSVSVASPWVWLGKSQLQLSNFPASARVSVDRFVIQLNPQKLSSEVNFFNIPPTSPYRVTLQVEAKNSQGEFQTTCAIFHLKSDSALSLDYRNLKSTDAVGRCTYFSPGYDPKLTPVEKSLPASVRIVVPEGHPNLTEDPVVKNSTFFTVNVPTKTRISIESVDTQSTGARRSFVNDSVPLGKSTKVPMFLEFLDNSGAVKATMKYDLDIVGGQTVTVTFPD